MKIEATAAELQKSNATLSEERAMLSGRLASIEGVINSEVSDAEKISLLKAAYQEWAAPKAEPEKPKDKTEEK